ncbi:MAG: hypothetical protein GWP91_20595 [Rhodobacterales bacterium]|nr:hypothetical protein [Rhodobacterales bacterium]
MSDSVVKWEQSFEDHVLAENALVWYRIRLRARSFAFLVVVSVLLIAVGQWVTGMVILAGLALGLAVVVPVRWTRRRLQRNGQHLFIGPTQWTFDATGVRHKNPLCEGGLPWSGVVAVRRTTHHLLLFVNTLQATYLPLRAVSDVDGLLSRIEQWRQEEAPEMLPTVVPEDAPWTFDYSLTLDDNAQFAVELSRADRRRPMRSLIAGLLLIFLGILEGFLLDDGQVQVGFTLLLLVISLGVLLVFASIPGFTLAMTRFRLRRAAADDPNLVSTQMTHLALDDRGLTYLSARGSGWIAWDGTSQLSDLSGCIGLMIAPKSGYVLPDRIFADSDERARFVTEVQEWIGRAARKGPGDVVPRAAAASTSVDNPFAPPESR